MNRITCLCAAAGVALTAGSAWAQPYFYGTNNLSGTNGYTTGADQLVTFDWATAAWAEVGGAGNGIQDQSGADVSGLGGLDFDHRSGILWAACSFGSNPGGMYMVNPVTGDAVYSHNTQVPMHDLAWDPVTGRMHGTDAAGNLWIDVDIPGNEVNLGNYGIGSLEVGIGFDNTGRVHVHDLLSDGIWISTAPVLGGPTPPMALLHALPFDSNYSQGLFVDWTTNLGYHAAFNGSAFAQENWGYTLALYGPGPTSVFAYDPNGLPQVEVGDLTYLIPAPGAIALLGIGGLLAGRRRR